MNIVELKAARLTHVGIHVEDADMMRQFYVEVMGLRISDIDVKAGICFLSAEPEQEHHQVVLLKGRTASRDATLIQQISFRCDDAVQFLSYYRRFKSSGVTIERTPTHGNAFSIYAFDPEGNRIEVYWCTGLIARQPFAVAVDLDQDFEAILEQNRELVRRHGKTGYRNNVLILPAKTLS